MIIVQDSIYRNCMRKYFLYCSISVSILFISLPLLFYIYDPLQIFHKSFFHNGEYLNKNMRIQAAGIIKWYDFDSLILGTSIFENTSAGEAEKLIGGKFFNISAYGSSYFERDFILSSALYKKLKTVIYSLDDFYLDCMIENVIFPSKNWSYLYDKNRLNDFRIYFQKKYILNIFDPYTGLTKVNLDSPNAWSNKTVLKSEFGGPENWFKADANKDFQIFLSKDLPRELKKANTKTIELSKNRLLKTITYLNSYLVYHIKQYPKTTFHLVFPPYSRLRYAYWLLSKPEDFLLHQAIIHHFAVLSKSIPNMHVYGFEDMDFLDDFENYKDTVHYHAQYNSYILESIGMGKHELTAENVDAYLSKCLDKAENFDMDSFNEQIQNFINNNN